MVDFQKLEREGLCACGEPLHYSSPAAQKTVEALSPSGNNGTVLIATPTATYRAQRHYLALHGVRAIDLPSLADAGIVEVLSDPQSSI